MDSIKIKNIIKRENLIIIKYECTGKWNNFLYSNIDFFSEYDCNITKVPKSIAVLPFLCDILPIAFVFNLEIVLDLIDKTFFDHIRLIKRGYQQMYPKIAMKGKITYKNIDLNEYCTNNSALFFSGGVDGTTTLFQHIKEKPDLITIKGFDINIKDKKAFNNANKSNKQTSKLFDIQNEVIRSNFREVLNYSFFFNK